MKRFSLLLFLLLAAAIPALGQAGTTVVSATVQDSQGHLYSNCQWSVVFVGQNTTPGAGPYSPAPLLNGQQGTCDSFGRFSINLADNILTVFPQPSQWSFSICSTTGYQGGPFCLTNFNVTITGGSQDLTSTLTPLMPILPVNAGGGNPAGSNKQVQINNNGSFGAAPTFTFDSTINLLSAPSITATTSISSPSITITGVGSSINPLCPNGPGGSLTTSGCFSGPPLGSAAQVPVMNQSATAYVPQSKSWIDIRDLIDCTGVTPANTVLNNLTGNSPATDQAINGKVISFANCPNVNLAATWLIKNQAGFRVTGLTRSGANGSGPNITWTGGTAAMIDMEYVDGFKVDGLSLQGGANAITLINIDKTGSGGILNTTDGIIQSNTFASANPNVVLLNISPISTQNVEDMRALDNTFACNINRGTGNMIGVGIALTNSSYNTKNEVVDHNNFTWCNWGVWLANGSGSITKNEFSSLGGPSGTGAGADIRVGITSDTVRIEDNIDEGGTQFFNFNGDVPGFGANFPVIFKGNHFAPAGSENLSNYWINVIGGNGWILEGNGWDQDSSLVKLIGSNFAGGINNGIVSTRDNTFPNFNYNQWWKNGARYTNSNEFGIQPDTLLTYGLPSSGGSTRPSPVFDLRSYFNGGSGQTDIAMQYLVGNMLFKNPQGGSPSFTFDGYFPNLTISQIPAVSGADGIQVFGVAGSTTYTYSIVAYAPVGNAPGGATLSTATGNASLSVSNYVQITWAPTSGATKYCVWRTVGGSTQGNIGCVSALQPPSFGNPAYAMGYPQTSNPVTGTYIFNDTGLAGDSSSLPSANTTGTLSAGPTTLQCGSVSNVDCGVDIFNFNQSAHWKMYAVGSGSDLTFNIQDFSSGGVTPFQNVNAGATTIAAATNVVLSPGTGTVNTAKQIVSTLATGTSPLSVASTTTVANFAAATADQMRGCTGSTAGDICYWNGSSWTRLAGNGTSTQWLQETSVGVPSWTVPAGAGNVATSGSPANGNLTKFSGATTITNGDLSGDATTSGTLAVTVSRLNGTSLGGLATGLLKNTTSTGVPSIATSADVIALWTGTCDASHTLSGAGTCITSAGVTSFSAGNLSPLFTTSVATATTTPALTFSLSTATANQLFGNPTGSTAAPVYFGVNSPLAFSAGALGCATCGVTGSPLSQFAATTSAQLRGVISDESGTGVVLFANGAFGTPTSVTLTNATGLPLTTGVTGILPPANGGTGVASPAAHTIPIGEGSTAFSFQSPSTTGLCFMSNGTSADPTFQACPSGFTNPMTIAGQMISSTSLGAAIALSGPTTPNGATYTLTSTPVSGAAGVVTWAAPGVAGRCQGLNTAGCPNTNSDTIVTKDCNANRIEYMGSLAVTITLPTAATLGVPACAFRVANNLSTVNDITITPTTWTIDGLSSVPVHNGDIATVYVDPNSTTNWAIDVVSTSLVAGTGMSFTRSASTLTINGPMSGMTATQIPVAATAFTVTSSLPLAGSGAGVVSGPTTVVSGNIASFTGTGGQIADSTISATSGNIAVGAGKTIGSADTGTPKFTFATSAVSLNQPLTFATTSNQAVFGTTTNLTTLTFPASSGAVTVTAPNVTSGLFYGSGSAPSVGVLHVAGSTFAATSGPVSLASDVSNQLPISAVGSVGLTATSPMTIASTGAIAWSPTTHQVEAPLVCSDSSGSGTAQSCSTSPTFTPAAGDSIIYTTTTANTGALTLNVNTAGAKTVQKWQGTAMVSGDLKANVPILAVYDGTNWQVQNIGNPPAAGGTVTSIGLVGTANQITVTGSSPITTSGSWTLSLPAALSTGTDNSTAGTLQQANGSANAHTIWSSGATTTNTIQGFAIVPTTGHLLDCTVTSTTCLLHDSGVVTANAVVASSPGAGIAHFAGSTQTVTSSAVSLTADVTGVLPLANMTQLFQTNAQTATYQVVAADFAGCKTIPVASGTFTITLVASGSQPAAGQCIHIVNYGTGVVTIARSGQNINGGTASITLNAGSASAPTSSYVVSDGTNYEATVNEGIVNLGTPTTLTLTNATGLPVGGIASMAADTMAANMTSGSASPTAVVMPTTTHGVWLAEGTGSAPVATAAGTAHQVLASGGGSADGAYADQRDAHIIPLCASVGGTASGAVTYASGWTPTNRAGTNNIGCALQAIPNTGATLYIDNIILPGDWDTANQAYLTLIYGSGANTSGTVIWTVSSACTKQDGSITDDPAFVAESAFATQTMATANRSWGQNGQFTHMTSGNNCIVGSPVELKVVLSGSATSAINFTRLSLSIATLPNAAQAN